MTLRGKSKNQVLPVVLGAGARRGAYLLGLLRLLECTRLPVSFYMGASIGSVVAALYTNGKSPAQIGSIFRDELFRYSVFGWLNPANWIRSISEPCSNGRVPIWISWLKMLTLPVNPLRYVTGGIVDLVPAMERLVQKENLKPQPNLRIVAFDLLHNKAVVFGGRRRAETADAIYAGGKYNLAQALAGACCIAMPLMMRPVACNVNGQFCLLVDPGLFQQANPSHLAGRRAIVGKLIEEKPAVQPRSGDITINLSDRNEPLLSRITEADLARMSRKGFERARRTLADRGLI